LHTWWRENPLLGVNMPDLLNLPSTAAMMVTVDEMKDVYFIEQQLPILAIKKSVLGFCTQSNGSLVQVSTTAMILYCKWRYSYSDGGTKFPEDHSLCSLYLSLLLRPH
jgi:hypothetical protein